MVSRRWGLGRGGEGGGEDGGGRRGGGQGGPGRGAAWAVLRGPDGLGDPKFCRGETRQRSLTMLIITL
jgi:hypothetical protein